MGNVWLEVRIENHETLGNRMAVQQQSLFYTRFAAYRIRWHLNISGAQDRQRSPESIKTIGSMIK